MNDKADSSLIVTPCVYHPLNFSFGIPAAFSTSRGPQETTNPELGETENGGMSALAAPPASAPALLPHYWAEMICVCEWKNTSGNSGDYIDVSTLGLM